MSLEEAIIEAETLRFRAIVGGDPAQLRECLAENMVYVHSNSVVEDRDAFIAKLVSGERKYLGFKPGARTFRQLGDAVACIGDLEVRSLAGTTPLIYTAVYERQGPWKMVLWHSCTHKHD